MANYREVLPIFEKSITIVTVSPSPRYIVYLAAIIDNLLRRNVKIKLINFSYLDNPTLFPLSKYTGNYESSRMIKFLISHLRNENLEFAEINLRKMSILTKKRYKLKNWKSVLKIDTYDGALSNSIASFFSTYRVKSENTPRSLLGIKKLTIKSIKNFELILSTLTEILSLEDNTKRIIFINGRNPHEAAIRYFAEKNRIPFLVLEHGSPPNLNRFHLSEYQTNVESEMSKSLSVELEYELQNNERSHVKKILDNAQIWLESNATDKKFNHFLTKTNSDFNSQTDKKIAVIFTSSIGEFKSNKGLDTNGWDSQLEAIVETSKYLALHDYEVLVRIHPNAGNNSFIDLKNLVSTLKKHMITFYSPWDKVSSYELLKRADVVFTWGSTIGLESSARGIPTYLFGRSYYDEIADIRFFTKDNFSMNLRKNLEPELWNVDKNRAMLAVYIAKNNGYFVDKIGESDSFRDFRILFQKKFGRSNRIKRLISKKYHGEVIFIFLRIFRNGIYASPNDFRRILKIIMGEKASKRVIRAIFRY